MRRLTRIPLALGVLAVAASCASVEREAPVASDLVAVEAATPQAAERTFRIEPRDDGWRIEELLDWLHQETGISMLLDASNGTWKHSRVHLGPEVIAESDLFRWFRALMSGRRWNVVQLSREAATHRQQWFLMDAHGIDPDRVAVFVDESELPSYASRDKLLVVTAFACADRDTTRIRNALVESGAGTAELRVQDIPGSRVLVVQDFVPALLRLKSELDRLNAAATK